MYRAIVWSPDIKSMARNGGVELIKEWQSDESLFIWLDLNHNNKPEEKELIETEFALHPLAISDAQRDRHPPKYEHFNSHDFILLKEYSGMSEEAGFDTNQLAMFTGKRFIITRTSNSSTVVNTYRDKMQNKNCSDITPELLLAKLSQSVADTYIQELLDVEDRLEILEDNMFSNPSDKLLEEIITIRSHLRKLSRNLSYHKQLFHDFRHSPENDMLLENQHEWTNVFDHTERAFSLSLLHYDLADNLVEGYISVSSHRLNQIMKILTIFTVIFVPLSFIAGIYGMNFENMPELKSRYGYYILLGFMLGLAGLLLFIFRKRKWL